MTDMHRDGFEREISEGWKSNKYPLGITDMTIGERGEYQKPMTRAAFNIWQAALRYRDEQARCECAYTCKFCRDEQEKQA